MFLKFKNSYNTQDTIVSFLYFLSAYVFYVAQNGYLANFRSLIFGLITFVLIPTIICGLICHFLHKKNIKLSTSFLLPIFFCILFLKFFKSLIILILFIILLSFVGYKIGRKILPITVIFSLSFIFMGSSKFFENFQSRYEIERNISDPKFIQEIKDYYQSFKKDANFIFKPNIYHIVLDTYPSNQTFLKVYNIDNSKFYKNLRERNFKVYENAYSNREYTSASMNRVFHMKLFDDDIDHFSFYGKNPAWGTLFAGGYNAFCTFPCHSQSANPGQFTERIQPLGNTNKQGLLSWTYKSFFQYYINFYLGNSLSPFPPTLVEEEDSIIEHKKLTKNTKKQNNLFYIHVVKHPNPKKKQTLFDLNKKVIEFLDDLEDNDPNSIIIIHSEHGNRSSWMKEREAHSDTTEENFGVLQAVRFPKECKQFNQIEVLSQVNYYRYIHSCLRGEKEPRHLEPANSYMKGTTVKEQWDSSIKRKFYMFIENNQVLEEPIEVDIKTGKAIK